MFVHQLFKKDNGGDLFGVELEMEGGELPHDLPFKYWRCEHDGSLRGADNAEYVLVKPLPLEEAKESFRRLVDFIKEVGVDPDPSRRTSAHLHVDCRSLTMYQLMNFITLLVVFEEFLVSWCGKERKGNLFCLQSKDAEGFFIKLEDFLISGKPLYLNDEIRYSAINLASLPKYGSVEIRSLRGTLDPDVFGKWIDVISHLRKLAEIFDKPISIVKEMSEQGADAFAKKILGNFYKDFYKGKGRSAALLEAMRRGQDFAFFCEREDVSSWLVKEKQEEDSVKKKIRFELEPGFDKIDDHLRVIDVLANF